MQRTVRRFSTPPKVRPHPAVLEYHREARRHSKGWLISKICDLADNIGYFHAERPRRSISERALRRVGAAACAFFLASGIYGATHTARTQDGAEGFRLDVPPKPVAATHASDETLATNLIGDERDPLLYASVDMSSVGRSVSHSLSGSFNTLAAVEFGGAGFGLIGGAGLLQRRRRNELQARPVVEAAASQIAQLNGIFKEECAPQPAPVPAPASQEFTVPYISPTHPETSLA